MKKKPYLIAVLCFTVVVAGLAIAFKMKTTTAPESAVESEVAHLPETDLNSAGSTHPEKSSETAFGTPHQEANSSPSFPQDKKSEMIKNFMESSRVSDEFAAMDGIVDQQIEFIKESGQLSEEALNELTEVLNKHINSENLSKIYTDKLRQEMSDEELAELVKIHQEPVMQQFAEAEKYSRTEEGQKEMYEALTNPTKTPISKERAQLLEGIDSKGLHLTEFTLSTLEKMSDSLETALEKPGTKLTPEQKKQREDMEKLMGAQIKEATQAKLAVMLSHMSEDQLQQFKASLEKGPKQKEVLIKQSASTQVHDESMTGIVAAVQKDQKKDKN